MSERQVTRENVNELRQKVEDFDGTVEDLDRLKDSVAGQWTLNVSQHREAWGKKFAELRQEAELRTVDQPPPGEEEPTAPETTPEEPPEEHEPASCGTTEDAADHAQRAAEDLAETGQGEAAEEEGEPAEGTTEETESPKEQGLTTSSETAKGPIAEEPEGIDILRVAMQITDKQQQQEETRKEETRQEKAARAKAMDKAYSDLRAGLTKRGVKLEHKVPYEDPDTGRTMKCITYLQSQVANGKWTVDEAIDFATQQEGWTEEILVDPATYRRVMSAFSQQDVSIPDIPVATPDGQKTDLRIALVQAIERGETSIEGAIEAVRQKTEKNPNREEGKIVHTSGPSPSTTSVAEAFKNAKCGGTSTPNE